MEKIVKTLLVCLLTCSTSLYASIVADWQFNDANPGETLAPTALIADASGNARHLSQVGDPFSFASSSTGTGASIEMYVGDNYIVQDPAVTGSSFSVAYDEEVSFEAMIRIENDYAGYAGILQKERVNNTEMWWRMETNGTQRFYWRVYKDASDPAASGYAYSVTGSTAINDGEWHLLKAVKGFNADTQEIVLSIYCDGILEDSISNGSYLTDFDQGGKMFVGSFDGVTSRDLVGNIDYVTIDYVPEPATMALLAAGMLFAARKRRI